MRKVDLIGVVAKRARVNKHTAEDSVDAVFEAIAKSIKKDKALQIPGFGTFTVRSNKARKGRNPRTGAEIDIRPSPTVRFKPSPSLKKGL